MWKQNLDSVDTVAYSSPPFQGLGRLRGASLVAQMVKNLPAMQETQVQFLGWEDPAGEGNGNPLQDSCLENSMNKGTWRATVHGIAQSWTRNKQHFITLVWCF